MKSKIIFALALSLMAYFGQARMLYATKEPEALLRIRKAVQSKKSLEANFSQKVEQSLFPDDESNAVGHLLVKRPNYLEWTYEKPEKKRIVYDGKSIIVDGEKNEQIGGLSLEESFSFLWGKVDPRLFVLKTINQNQLELSVKPELNSSIKSIQVILDNDSLVKEAIVSDQVGGKSRLVFSNWKLK